MQCDTKTMIKTGLGLGGVVVAAYVFVPDARALIDMAAPFLLFLLCPISMLFMMKSMKSRPGHVGTGAAAPNVKPLTQPEGLEEARQ